MPLEPKVRATGNEQGLNRWRKHLEQRLKKKKKSGVQQGTEIPLSDMGTATSSTSVDLYTRGGFTGYGYRPVGPDTDQEDELPIVRPGPGEISEGEK
jgi:hypothetical protein